MRGRISSGYTHLMWRDLATALLGKAFVRGKRPPSAPVAAIRKRFAPPSWWDWSGESDKMLIKNVGKVSDSWGLLPGSHNIPRTICYQLICVQLPPLHMDPARRLQLVASPRLRKLQGAGRTGSLRQLGGAVPNRFLRFFWAWRDRIALWAWRDSSTDRGAAVGA